MNAFVQFAPAMERGFKKTEKIQTTLYRLMEVISEEVQKDEEGLVVQTVLHLMNTGCLKFSRQN